MLWIGFLPVEKAVPDKPRDKRETNGRGQQLSLPEHRLRAAETRAGCTGRWGCISPRTQPRTGALPSLLHTAGSCGSLMGFLRAVKWWIWLSGTFYDRERWWGSAKRSRAGIAEAGGERDRQGLEDCRAQPPPPAGPSPGPPSARAVLTWKQKIK